MALNESEKISYEKVKSQKLNKNGTFGKLIFFGKFYISKQKVFYQYLSSPTATATTKSNNCCCCFKFG
jgi:hypothetical protein